MEITEALAFQSGGTEVGKKGTEVGTSVSVEGTLTNRKET